MKNKGRKKYPKFAQDELDLHGFTRAEANEEVWSFLMRAEEKGFKRVLIVTGRGLHSENGGVLKKHVQKLLDEEKYFYKNAKITEGGEGAIDIYLE